LKKLTGSVWFQFYKSETKKYEPNRTQTEPKLKKPGQTESKLKKPSQIEPKLKKHCQTGKNRAKPV